MPVRSHADCVQSLCGEHADDSNDADDDPRKVDFYLAIFGRQANTLATWPKRWTRKAGEEAVIVVKATHSKGIARANAKVTRKEVPNLSRDVAAMAAVEVDLSKILGMAVICQI